MDTRKVQITGKSTYIVTLPKKWALESGLEAGSAVNISYQDDGSLLIEPPKPKKTPETSKKKKVKKDNIEEIKRDIIGTYIMGGYQLLEVKGKNKPKKVESMVRELCRDLIGFEIVEVQDSKIVIQDFLDTEEFTIEAGLKRMSSLVFLMLNDLLEALQAHDPETLRDIIDRDSEVDRMFFLLSKLYISRLNLKKPSKSDRLSLIEAFHYRLAAGELERVGDHTVKIAKNLENVELSKAGAARIGEIGRFAQQLVSDSVSSFRLSDVQLANRVLKQKELFEEELLGLASGEGPLESVPSIEIIIDSFSRIKDYAGNIAELTIDLSQL